MFSSAVIQIVLKKINAINVYTILIHDLNKISLRYKEYICQKKGTRSICNWRKCKFIGSTIESTIDSCDREEERRYIYIYIESRASTLRLEENPSSFPGCAILLRKSAVDPEKRRMERSCTDSRAASIKKIFPKDLNRL